MRATISAVLCALMILVFGVELVMGSRISLPLMAGFIPASVGTGAEAGSLPVWVTPLSAAFVHAGAVHLLFNMVMLLWCGRMVDAALGARLTGLLFVLGAYGAAAGQWLLNPQETLPVIGASGAISAIFAVYALLFSQQQVRAVGPFSGHFLRVLWLAAAWIGIQALIGLAMSSGTMLIAIGAHIGGFVTGLALARPMLRWRYHNA